MASYDQTPIESFFIIAIRVNPRSYCTQRKFNCKRSIHFVQYDIVLSKASA
jgi:hypothetical protein